MSVQRIDRAVLQQDKAQVAFAEVTKFWGDVDAFLDAGIYRRVPRQWDHPTLENRNVPCRLDSHRSEARI